MAAWWDRWLRGRDGRGSTGTASTLFVRSSTRPEPDLEEQRRPLGHATDWPSSRGGRRPGRSTGPATAARRARTSASPPGSTAPATCPGGSRVDQREDDARSLTWEWDAAGEVLVGQPRVRLRVSADAPAGVAVGQAVRRLPRRHLGAGHPRQPRPGLPRRRARAGRAEPAGARPDVRRRGRCSTRAPTRSPPGRRLRLSVAGADWPNTVAPPAPVTLTVHDGALELPLLAGRRRAAADVPAGPAPLLRGGLRRVAGP